MKLDVEFSELLEEDKERRKTKERRLVKMGSKSFLLAQALGKKKKRTEANHLHI